MAKRRKKKTDDEKTEKKEKRLDIPTVPNGVGTANDHERRLCIIERELGLR